MQQKKSWGSASAWIVSSSSDLPRTTGNRFPHTGSRERRKCTASNGIRTCRNIARQTARSDHTTGGEWRCLFATHANRSDSTEAINLISVTTSTIYRHLSWAQHLGLAWILKPKVYLVAFQVQLGSHPTNVSKRPHRFLPLSARPLRFNSAWSQFGSPPTCMVGSGL